MRLSPEGRRLWHLQAAREGISLAELIRRLMSAHERYVLAGVERPSLQSGSVVERAALDTAEP